MPNTAFATGFLNGFIDTQNAERDRRERNTRDVINFMVSTGRLRNYDDLKPLLQQLYPQLGAKPKGGKGGGGGGQGGQQDPDAMLRQYIDPMFKMMQQGPQGQQQQPQGQQGGQGSSPPSMFLSDTEIQARDTAKTQQGEDLRFATWQKEHAIESADTRTLETQRAGSRIKEIQEQNKGKTGSDLHQLYLAKQQAFEVSNGRPPSDEENAKLMVEARDQWQSAGRKVTSEEAYTKSWMTDAAKDGALAPAQEKIERLKAKKAWALASQSETPVDKLGRAEALARYREQLTGFTPQDLHALSQTITIGGKSSNYLDVSGFTGKEKAQAMVRATQLGMVPTTAKQTEVLESGQAASRNLEDFLAQIKAKLPKDAASRPLTSIENKLQAYFQTDTDLASASAWDTTIIPMLRAISTSGLGRITNKELALAESARPKITDTVAVAARNVEIVQRILQNAIDPIMTRGGAGAGAGTGNGAAPGAGGQAGKPDAGVLVKDVTTRLKAAPAGRYKDTASNTYWVKQADGTLRPITKAEYDK